MSLIHISKQLAVAGVRHEIVLAGASRPLYPVIFRAEKSGEAKGAVTAVFPCGDEGRGQFTVYAHLGQHSTGTMAWYLQRTRAAKPEEYASLLKELKEIYETEMGSEAVTLKVIQKFPSRDVIAKYNKAIEAAHADKSATATYTATAAEAKDPEAPPYSRKRNLTSLNDKRLAKVLALLCVCNKKSLGLKGVIESAKDMSVKEAQELLLKFQAQADTNNEALRDINDILKGFFGSRNGFFGHIATNISEAIQGKAIKDNPYAVVKEQITMYANAIKYVDGYVNRVLAVANKRGISDTQLHALARRK
jgi:hypothetical protein